MTMEHYLKIMDSHVHRYGIPAQVSLQGEGEPTLNHDFFNMAAHVRRIGSEPTTITNGSYKYPEHFAQSFKKIGISLDTLDPAEASRVGRHNLARVLEFIESVSSFLEVTIFTVAISPSFHAVAAWCQQRGLKHIVQPLQSKPDYNYRYPQHVVVHPRPSLYQCAYLQQDLMRYYAIDSGEFPCCFIKDARHYVSIADLKQQLANKQIPASCSGCKELK
ncbi:hypothetical protein S2091_0808 [Solimicrobium silvestre]|uniref:Radical SAM superfamily n=2 Tax=Solimicrobium silvestre TaxID=2099400 RepID=A0A2S9H498_9BURK|nr:hypothetical protein S2091_0808 [Solimicrobium silvestre]